MTTPLPAATSAQAPALTLKLDFRQIGTCAACSVFDMDALLLFDLCTCALDFEVDRNFRANIRNAKFMYA